MVTVDLLVSSIAGFHYLQRAICRVLVVVTLRSLCFEEKHDVTFIPHDWISFDLLQADSDTVECYVRAAELLEYLT